jgi:fatty-acyl-CoA synthase/feruloyl-CoA synthase
MLERNARRSPESETLVYGEQRLTYRQLDALVDQTARALQRLGLVKGERVGLLSFNSDQFVIAYYAILKLGAIVVPINPRSAPQELAYQLNDCGASTLLFDPVLEGTVRGAQKTGNSVTRIFIATRQMAGWDDLPSLAQSGSEEALDIVGSEEDDAEIIYTSGTTGKPKGVVLDHHCVIWCGLNIAFFVTHASVESHSKGSLA